MRKSRAGCLSILVFFTISIIALISYVLVNRYVTWESEFTKNAEFTNFSQDSKKTFTDLVTKYNQDKSEYVFIELTKEEALFLFTESLQASLSEGFEIKESKVLSYPQRWIFYFKGDYKGYSLPWFGFVIQKDNSQGIDLYFDDIYIGDYSFQSFSLGGVIDKFNMGLRNGLHVVNDGNFAGRYFENIELGQDSIIIKSRNLNY